jgi:hypothetical protein
VFRDSTFDHKATNILVLDITPKDLQPPKPIYNTSRNTNFDTKLGKKTLKCKNKIQHT